MADKKAIDKDYLLVQLQNYTRDVIAAKFVPQQKNYSLISKNDLGQITANQLAIEELQTATSTAALNALINAQIAKVVAEAPASYDTLKEIADWITSHESSASALNTRMNGLSESKADKIAYDSENGILSLMAGEKVLNSVAVSGGGGGSHYLTYPEFEVDFITGHITATGGTGVDFRIDANGHLESEVL